MKKIITTSIACLLLLPALFIACTDKGGGTDEPQKTRTELITASSWRVSAATWGGATYTIPSCQADNRLTFQGGGAGEANEGATKCNTGDPQTYPFTWSFQSGETVLSLSNPIFTGGSNTLSILTLTTVELTVSQPYTIGGVTKALEITFVH